ncbi:hypothetical protein FGO68_gene16849 [Halteria grandinella]|uniref:Uncharacterized protein n=1 Tax=Halteria grandinella TaxID=5974 RepID=A0A8J8T382_HALGN|nr:hypothetical protein FGO68_gene16849 [Halteria grandinella]
MGQVKRRRGRPAKIENYLEKLPEPKQTRAIFRKILTLLKQSKENSIKGRCQNKKIGERLFQEALAEKFGLDQEGLREFTQPYKLIKCHKKGETKPEFIHRECSLIWDVCYRFSTEAMNAFFTNNILQNIFEIAFVYLAASKHESRIYRDHNNKGKVLTPQQQKEYDDKEQRKYLNTLEELYQYYCWVIRQN